MYIIQMADLHIGSSVTTVPGEEDFITKIIELIKEKIPKYETILICLCGDIIDSKENPDDQETKRRYQNAANLIKKFKRKIEDDYKVIIKCCPGNHDATHIDDLYDFIKEVDHDYPSKTELRACYTVEIENVETKILFVNSCKGDQHEKGCIDYDALEKELKRLGKDSEKIIVLHHTIMSMFENDSSSIRNAAKLVNLIDEYSVIGVLHGHIHGREILRLGKNNCKIIGTGALLSRGNPNVNSQLNIIELENTIFSKILNCRYNADGGNEPWDTQDLIHSEPQNIFSGNRFSKVYKQLIDTLDVSTLIYNMRMEINSKYDEFDKDLQNFLGGDKLKLGDKEWTYFKLAKMWQAEKVPEDLYFNHGSYFKIGEKSGIDYVLRELEKKPTSNRIVLPTYNMENVYQSLDDKENLPSLVSIQFGMDGERLIVHMHLRALEAKQFLKINICEIQYLLKQLHGKIKFENVKIIISAFRVQKKEGFHCFLKSKIDVLEEADLTILVHDQKFSDLCQLFKEKRGAKETITQIKGISTIYKVMKKSNKARIADSKKAIYSEAIIKLLESALDVYEELDKIHKTSSIQSSEEAEYEKEIDHLLGEIIKELEGLEKESVQ